jgi:hypothetical protein
MRLYNTFVLIAVLAPLGALAQTNPIARATDPANLGGTWNGANLERRSNCASAQNNGSRGTYAQYEIVVDKANAGLFVDETAITGLRCTYTGTYGQAGSAMSWSGAYSCSDGKHGTFQSQEILITPHEISLRLAVKLDTTETCEVEAILGGSRL